MAIFAIAPMSLTSCKRKEALRYPPRHCGESDTISYPSKPEKAQNSIDEADDLCKEIRIENKLTDESGKKVQLKPRTPVEMTIEVDQTSAEPEKSASATTPRKS